MDIITNRYKRETGKSAYKFNWFGKRIHNQDYINWLEKQCTIKGVVSSLPNKALKDSQLSDMISGYKTICKPDANFEKYYSKGFTECWEWIKRTTK
jgi:hypothetical protein